MTAVPELPEVQALVDFLAERTDGLAVASVELASFSVLKTFDPPPTALAGGMVDGWSRHGKFLDLERRRHPPGVPPGPRRLAALVGGAAHTP